MKIHDISLSLDKNTVIYPGNPVMIVESYKRIPKDPTNLSKITFGSHTGTHIDAPKHAFSDMAGIDGVSLEKCVGKCRVLDMLDVKEKMEIRDFERCGIESGERILVKTKNSERGFGKFHDDSVYLDGDAADYLADKGIILFGIDSLSIKKRGDEDARPHTSLLKNGIVIFEGLDLSKVEPGEYEFIGLALKFTDLDGAPARAILISKD